MKKMSVFLVLLSLLFFVSCASTQGSRYREGDNVGQETTLTVETSSAWPGKLFPRC